MLSFGMVPLCGSVLLPLHLLHTLHAPEYDPTYHSTYALFSSKLTSFPTHIENTRL